MRIVLSVFWMFLVAWIFNGLLHATDIDVNGIEGLVSGSVLVSVTIYSFAMMLPLLGCLFIWRRAGYRGLLRWALGFAGVTSLVVTAAGSTATNLGGLAWSFLGVTLLILAIIVVAVLPAILSWRSQTAPQA